jgi:hypothetical protein
MNAATMTLLGLFLLSAMSCKSLGEEVKRDKDDAPEMRFVAFIGTSQKFFEDRGANAGDGGPAGGTLVLWINGEPVHVYQGNALMLGLNEWLAAGRNELTFSGAHTLPVYVKIGKLRSDPPAYVDLAGQRIFNRPVAEGRADPLVFQVGRAPVIPAPDALSEEPADREQYQRDTREVISQLQDRIQQHAGKEAAELLYEGPLLWVRTVYGTNGEKHLREQLESTSKFIADPNTKLVGKKPALQMAFGKRLVLVYAGTSTVGESYVLSLERAGKRLTIGPLQLARLNRKWVIWDE